MGLYLSQYQNYGFNKVTLDHLDPFLLLTFNLINILVHYWHIHLLESFIHFLNTFSIFNSLRVTFTSVDVTFPHTGQENVLFFLSFRLV